ncbi:MAG TPA: glycosyltransferase family 4 protein [Thermoplasmata archaeon]
MGEKNSVDRATTDLRTRNRPSVWLCSFLPESTGAGVERFASMISAAVLRTGRMATIVNIGCIGSSQKIARRFRYYAAWRVGRYVSRHAMPDDIVICSNFFSWNAPKKRSIVVFHGTDVGRASRTKSDLGIARSLAVKTIGPFLEKRTARGRLAIAVSESAKEEVETHYGLKVQAVIPNGVDLRLFSPAGNKADLRRKLGLPQDKFLVLFVGTTDPRKGLGWILEHLLPEFGENIHLVVRSDLANPPSNTTVVRRLDFEELADLYRACDALLFPTEYEGCSFVLVEALACGLPPVTSSAGGGRDLKAVPELSPYVIEGRNPSDYLNRIRQLAGSHKEWARVSSSARAYAEKNCSVQQFESAYIRIIEQLENKN